MSVGMSVRENFEILEDYVVFRPSGKVTLERAIEMVMDAIAFAREHRIRKLLVNTSNLTGYEPPSLTARYFFVHNWARAARDVRVALVTRPERIDPQRFGITVAANLGAIIEVFTSEEDALKWIEDLK
jgi:stage II sporulation SpoAA-like protein